jgi:hypothetical protein
MSAMPRDAWRQHRQELASRLHDNPIWLEMQKTQDALDSTTDRGAAPPDGEYLRGLIVRFEFEAKRPTAVHP